MGLAEESVQIGHKMLENQDAMLENQDEMLGKQDKMLEKQDEMLEKQDDTIAEIKKVSEKIDQSKEETVGEYVRSKLLLVIIN